MKTTLNRVLAAVREEMDIVSHKRKAIEVIGPPSTGKTQAFTVLAKGRLCYCNTTQMHSDGPTSAPAPDLERREVIDLMHTKFKSLFAMANDGSGEPVILFFDEFAAAHTEVQKVINDILDRRVLADRKLPENVTIVLAGNGREHSSGVASTMAHTIRRKLVFKIGHDIEGSTTYAVDKGWHSEVICYLAMKPAAWYSNSDMADDESLSLQYRKAAQNNDPYACSSGWETISNRLKIYEAKLEHNKKIKDGVIKDKPLAEIYSVPDTYLFAACIGEARAVEFQAMRGTKIPSHPDLLEGRAEVPEEAMATWLCVARMGSLFSPGNSTKTCNVIKRLSPEFIEVFWAIAGKTAQIYLKGKGVVAKSGRLALIDRDGNGSPYFPGVAEILNDPRYSAMLEQQIK